MLSGKVFRSGLPHGNQFHHLRHDALIPGTDTELLLDAQHDREETMRCPCLSAREDISPAVHDAKPLPHAIARKQYVVDEKFFRLE